MSSEPTEHDFDEVVAVVLAAGAGTRLGASRPKAFVGLAGQVMVAHSLKAFEAHDAVDAIVLVVPDGWQEPAEVMVDDIGCDRVSSIEVGGASRAESVLLALAAVPDRRATAVLVHDAARPIVPSALIDRVLAPLADGYDAVVPALEVTDTLKQVNERGEVVATIDRTTVRRAQTPQCCRSSVLRAALQQLADSGDLAQVTDCAQAVAQAGGKVLVVPGDERSIKITGTRDFREVEAQLGGASEPVPDDGLPDDDDHEDVDAE
jgi:2-C-methyl-D-erythritol 4-phosphate cytidylyltransferase